MTHLISKTLLALAVSVAAASLCAVPAVAAEAKKPVKAKAKAKAKPVVDDEDSIKPGTPENEPDIAGTKVVAYTCELNNLVTVYTNDNDDLHVALRWKKRLHLLTRVGTTTGAQRFENRNFGLIWIGIPGKGMLLDSRQNRQLANECKSPDQNFVPQAPEVKVVDGLAPVVPPVLTRKEVKKLVPVLDAPHPVVPADQPVTAPLPPVLTLPPGMVQPPAVTPPVEAPPAATTPAATTPAAMPPAATTPAAMPPVATPAPVVTPPDEKK